MSAPTPHPLAKAFVTNPHLLVISIVVLLVGGWSALNGLPRLEDPIISNRNAQITTLFPGASAERVEALVSEPLEQKLKEVPLIKHIESTSRAGVSLVTVELADAVNEESNDAIFSEIRDRMNDAAAAFPEGVQAPVFDDKRNAVAFTLIAALSWQDGREQALSVIRRQAEELADRLRAVPGTDLVRIYGAPQEEIAVEVNGEAVTALGLSVDQVAQALRRADAKVPAGVLRSGRSDLLVEITGELDSVQRIREVPIRTLSDGRSVRLGDVAEVQRTLADPPRDLALHDGQRAILVAARVQADQRVDQWSIRANASLDQFRDALGGGIDVEVVFNQDTYTTARLGELGGNLALGAAVVFLVIFLVMGWRSSWIVSSALPLVASFTLFVVVMQGGKLHQMSIFGMIIALGLLIDNAIVVTDEVRHHLKRGASSLEAVSNAVHHLFMPLLSSTVTTILSFLPIMLLPGPAGDFVSSIAVSVVIALIGSFGIAMTVIATLAGHFGKEKSASRLPLWLREGLGHSTGNGTFGRAVGGLMRRPLLSVGLSLIIPVIGFALAGTLGSQFFPRTDRNMFEVELRLPSDASIERTREVAEAVSGTLADEAAVERVDWLVGGSFPTVYYNLIMNQDGARNYAHGIITATSFESVTEMMGRLQATLDERHPDAQILLTKFAQGPPANADVEFRLSGPDIGTLQTLGEEVRRHLAEHPGILHTQTTLPRGEPKLWLETEENEAQAAGLPLTSLASQLDAAYEGALAGSVLEDIEELPIRVRQTKDRRQNEADLRQFNLSLPSAPGEASRWAPLSAFASIDLRPEQGGISRRNGQRVNKIWGFANPEVLAIDIATDVLATLEAEGFVLPPGYSFQQGGEAENRDEAVGNLLLYLPVIIVLTIATLILTFRNVRIAAILLLVGPLSVGFGLLATWAMGFPISFNTILGSMGLMGLTFNDNIVVLAAINSDPKAKAGDPDAIRDAVLRCSRHLVSTTLTTIGSFLPLLIFIGGQFWPPLAIVLAGGVGGSTLLAITFTPALYRLLLCPRQKAGASAAPAGALPVPA